MDKFWLHFMLPCLQGNKFRCRPPLEGRGEDGTWNLEIFWKQGRGSVWVLSQTFHRSSPCRIRQLNNLLSSPFFGINMTSFLPHSHICFLSIRGANLWKFSWPSIRSAKVFRLLGMNFLETLPDFVSGC